VASQERQPIGPASRLSIEIDPPVSDVQAIERGLFSYEEGRLGNPLHAHFAVMLRTDTGQIQGGADCHVMWHRVFVKTLWLPETLRGRGLGTQIMLDVEAEAVKRRCLSIWLTALGDHACHFYRRLGYRVFGVHEDYIGGQALYSVRKELARPVPPPVAPRHPPHKGEGD